MSSRIRWVGWSPYTLDDDELTMRRTPLICAARRTVKVPVTFTA